MDDIEKDDFMDGSYLNDLHKESSNKYKEDIENDINKIEKIIEDSNKLEIEEDTLSDMLDGVDDDVSNSVDDKVSSDDLSNIVDDIDDKTLYANFNFKDIQKNNYLYNIFSPKNDKYKSFNYLKSIHLKLIKQGHQQSPLLNVFLFNAVILRRLQIIYQQQHKKLHDSNALLPENMEILKQIESLTTKQSKTQQALDQIRDRQRSGKDIHDLHNQELEENAKFIQKNIGEFSFKCKECGAIVSSGGIPHWGIKSKKNNEGTIYHVWSTEMFWAVKNNIIPLHIMAFFLGTSIEGIILTANLRGERMPSFDIIKEESQLKELQTPFENAYFDQAREKIT